MVTVCKQSLQEKVNKLHQEIIDECTKAGVRASIITTLQAGDINLFPQKDNYRIFKKYENG